MKEILELGDLVTIAIAHKGVTAIDVVDAFERNAILAVTQTDESIMERGYRVYRLSAINRIRNDYGMTTYGKQMSWWHMRHDLNFLGIPSQSMSVEDYRFVYVGDVWE